jgi:hypothetical protein
MFAEKNKKRRNMETEDTGKNRIGRRRRSWRV